MKDYKRLTEKTIGCFRYCLKKRISKYEDFNNYDAFFDYSMTVKRLGELEDKIERGELVDRDAYLDYLMTTKNTSELTDKEIEFFVKHNAEVRKQAVEEFAERVKMAFYCEFDELIPSIMTDKIDELVKEV